MRGVVFFDVDGTLVPRTTSSEYLSGFLGHASEVSAAERAYEAGSIDSRAWSVIDARGWALRTPAQVRQFLDGMPLVQGIPEVVDWCRAQDLLPVLATLAWEPVGNYLCDRFGFAESCGPYLSQADGRYTGEVASHFDEYDKRDYALTLATRRGARLERCAAIGDSRSDVPLFERVGFPVAFNASPALQALASACLAGGDLRVVPVLEGWLASRDG